MTVAVDISATCDDVRGAIFTKKPHSGCGGNVFLACTVTGDNLSPHGKRFCFVKM